MQDGWGEIVFSMHTKPNFSTIEANSIFLSLKFSR